MPRDADQIAADIWAVAGVYVLLGLPEGEGIVRARPDGVDVVTSVVTDSADRDDGMIGVIVVPMLYDLPTVVWRGRSGLAMSPRRRRRPAASRWSRSARRTTCSRTF